MNNPDETRHRRDHGSPLGSGVPGTSLAALSGRQRAIAWLIAQGQTNHQIGAEVGLNGASVAEEVEQLRRALGVSTRLHLAMLVRQHGPIGGTRPAARPTGLTGTEAR